MLLEPTILLTICGRKAEQDWESAKKMHDGESSRNGGCPPRCAPETAAGGGGRARRLAVILVGGGLLLAIVGAFALGEYRHPFHWRRISAGQLVAAREPVLLRSRALYAADVRSCSAVVYNGDRFNILAHSTFFDNLSEAKPHDVIATNVLNRMEAASATTGGDMAAGRMLIDAGRKRSLDTILAACRERGIPVVFAAYYANDESTDRHHRDVLFSSWRNTLCIRYNIRFDGRRVPRKSGEDPLERGDKATMLLSPGTCSECTESVQETDTAGHAILILDCGLGAVVCSLPSDGNEAEIRKSTRLGISRAAPNEEASDAVAAILDFAAPLLRRVVREELAQHDIRLVWQRDRRLEASRARRRTLSWNPHRNALIIRHEFSAP